MQPRFGDAGDAGDLRVLFAKALELPPEERPEFLNDPDMSPETRDELIALLEADRGSETYLWRTASSEQLAESGVGERFGVYETRCLLGQGGMGAVFKADRVDGELRQTVAIKVVRHAWLDPRALDRFRNERQLLATLEHAHIARLLDGGTRADGVAYLVMEYVEGVPLDLYCDRLRLSIADRLRLFLPLCDAVEYAHSRLVVHRDLKPSNVLVTAQGEPRLLDFGIAKALDASPAGNTQTVTMTPEFASPEQARGEAPTTATDVYGLGGVLYFLLTGSPTHPVAHLSREEIRRAVCETPPRLPGQLRPELKGDLENILLKALHNDPQRRYRSARELRDDLDRFLNRRPVLATRDGWTYRTRRFLQRRRFATAAAALALLAVAAGSGAAVFQARRAQRRFEQVRTLANRFVFDFEAAIRSTPGTLAARRMVAATARQYLADLSADAGHDSGLNRELAESYFRLSLVEMSAGESGPGLNDLKRSVALLGELKDGTRGSPPQRAQYILELNNLAAYQDDARSIDDANRSAGEAVRTARNWVAEPAHDPRAEIALAGALSEMGTLLMGQGKIAEARRALDEALRLGPLIHARSGRNDSAEYAQAVAGFTLGRVVNSLNEPAAALSALRESRRILDDLLQKHPENTQWSGTEVSLLAYTGDFLFRLSDKDPSRLREAELVYREADTLARRNVGLNPGAMSTLESAAFASMKLANHLDRTHRTEEAIPILQASMTAAGELVRKDPSSRRNRYIEASNRHLMGAYLVKLSRWNDALKALADAEHLTNDALRNSPGDLQLLLTQVVILIDQTRAERHLSRLPEARAHCRQALDVTAVIVERAKTSKRPIGSALGMLREEARLLGVHDFTLTVPGIQ